MFLTVLLSIPYAAARDAFEEVFDPFVGNLSLKSWNFGRFIRFCICVPGVGHD